MSNSYLKRQKSVYSDRSWTPRTKEKPMQMLLYTCDMSICTSNSDRLQECLANERSKY